MNTDVALYWVQEALATAAMLGAPLLAAGLMVGLVVSLFQAVTSIQEMTLSYIPKIVIVGAVLLTLSPWLIETLTDFTTRAFQFIPSVAK